MFLRGLKMDEVVSYHDTLLGEILERGFYLSIQLGIVIPTDELIFVRGGETTNQYMVSDLFCRGDLNNLM